MHIVSFDWYGLIINEAPFNVTVSNSSKKLKMSTIALKVLPAVASHY